MAEESSQTEELETTETQQSEDSTQQQETTTTGAETETQQETVIETAETEQETTQTEATWREDWREQMAGGDEKVLARLKRYASPENVIKAWRAAEQKISSGEFVRPLAEDASEEEVAAFREQNGIPQTWEEYPTELPDGMVIGENDKPLVDAFLQTAHAQNFKPDQVQAVLAAHFAGQEQMLADRAAKDNELKISTTDELRAEYGNEYRSNINMIQNMLDSAPGDAGLKIMSARAADGTPLGSDPDVIRFLVNTAREINPFATIVPNDTNALQAVESRITELEGMMADRGSAYHQGPESAKLKQEYRDLIDARDKSKGRTAA